MASTEPSPWQWNQLGVKTGAQYRAREWFLSFCVNCLHQCVGESRRHGALLIGLQDRVCSRSSKCCQDGRSLSTLHAEHNNGWLLVFLYSASSYPERRERLETSHWQASKCSLTMLKIRRSWGGVGGSLTRSPASSHEHLLFKNNGKERQWTVILKRSGMSPTANAPQTDDSMYMNILSPEESDGWLKIRPRSLG